MSPAKHGGGGMMVWACFAATEPGSASLIQSTTNSFHERYSEVRSEGFIDH